MDHSSPNQQTDKSSETVISPSLVSPPPNKKTRNDEIVLPSDDSGDEFFESVVTDLDSQDSVVPPLDSHEQSSNVGIYSLPWPAYDRIFYLLHNQGDLEDLKNLSQVSPHFRRALKDFMARKSNRPGLKEVRMWRRKNGFVLEMDIFPSNHTFHNFDKLDWKRFSLEEGTTGIHTLDVTIRRPDDPIIEQVIGLLSVRLWKVEIGLVRLLFPGDLPLVDRLIRSSTIDSLLIETYSIDDTTAPIFLSIVSHVTEVVDISVDKTNLSDPITFVDQMSSTSIPIVHLYNFFPSTLFGLPNHVWERILNEKLSTGSFDYIQLDIRGEKITTAPFVLPDTPIDYLIWKKAVKE